MKLKILLSLVLLFSASTMIFAEEHKPPDSKHVELDYLRKRPKDTTPEEVNATCYYINGNTITHMDNGDAISRTFLTFSPTTITIGTAPGIYEILIDTTSGGKYLGYLTLE